LVERINFAADFLGQTDLPGVQDMVERLQAQGDMAPEQFVDACADMVGCLNMSDETRSQLVAHAQKAGALNSSNKDEFAARAGEMFQMIAATAEFQLG
jgi:hypothetical protein